MRKRYRTNRYIFSVRPVEALIGVTAGIAAAFATETFWSDEPFRAQFAFFFATSVLLARYVSYLASITVIFIGAICLSVLRIPPDTLPILLKELSLLILLSAGTGWFVTRRKDTINRSVGNLSLIYDVLTSNSPLGVALWSKECRLVSLNGMIARLSPLPRQEQVGKHVGELYPEGGERLQGLMERVFSTEEPILREEFIGKAPSAPNEVRHWSVSFYPVHSTEGLPLVATLVEDITALQVQKRELERAKTRLENIIDALEECFLIVDQEGIVEYANSEAGLLLGVEHVIGRHLREVLNCEDSLGVIRAVEDVLEGRGRRIFLALISQPLKRLQLAIAPCERGVTILARDISEQHLYEETLRKSREQLSMALDAADAGLWSWDIEADRIELSVRSAEQLQSPSHIMTLQQFLDQVMERDRLEVKGHIDRALEKEAHFEVEFRIPLHDVELRWIRLIGRSSLSSDLRPLSIVGVQFDVSAEKAAEEELSRLFMAEQTARSEAEQANRMKDDFIAVVSHELRTPLNAILGWSQLLKKGLPKGMELSEAMLVIEQNAKSQAALIEDLLDVSRIVSGKVKITMQPVAIQELVDHCIETVALSAKEKNIEITQSSLFEKHEVSGDPTRLRQVILNLLTNAIKFTPPGGTIAVTAHAFSGRIEIRVKDTGVGMEPSFLPYAFEKYKQGSNTGARVGMGLGLGLAIVKQLVELHRGSVIATSEGKNKGSEFIVSLPELTQSEETRPESAVENSLTGLKILIVDNDQEAVTLVNEVLEQEGAEVVSAETAEEALQEISASHPSVIVSELSLETNEGFRLIDSVRTELEPDLRETPAIAISRRGGQGERRSAISAGFQLHLTKPINPQELVSAVREASLRKGRS